MSEEAVKMKETYQCLAGSCDHPPLIPLQPLQSHIRNIHHDFLEEGARKVPIFEVDFATTEQVRGKHTDIMRKASYGTCDKAASR